MLKGYQNREQERKTNQDHSTQKNVGVDSALDNGLPVGLKQNIHGSDLLHERMVTRNTGVDRLGPGAVGFTHPLVISEC